MPEDIMFINMTQDSECAALMRFRRALRRADIEVFDELLSKAEKHFPIKSQSELLPLSVYILSMEMVLLEELQKMGELKAGYKNSN